jgi:hypothetical protein
VSVTREIGAIVSVEDEEVAKMNGEKVIEYTPLLSAAADGME